jgi:hypothetical protein
MKYKKIIIGLLLVVAGGITACNKSLDSLLDNPNYPSLTTADVDLYLNQVQLSFNNFFQTASDYGAQLSRQQQWGGPLYANTYQPATFDGEWTTAYTGVVANADAMVPLAQSQKKYIQSGIARVLKAYTLGTLVDDFGDVPFSQADLGANNTTPKVDPGATVYAGVLTLLDSAIADFSKTGAAAGPATDLYYGGSATKWITLANTLKLKFLMQTRLVDPTATAKIQALITTNNLINTPAQDFVFTYSKSLSPDSRHPHYAADYVNSGGVGEYLSNYFMWKVAAEKYGGNVNLPATTSAPTTGDPRLRYYFYRQTTNYSWATQQSCPCYGSSIFGTSTFPAWYPSVPDKTPFCVIGKGYMGRDHGDNSGAPPDGAYRSGYGIYPAGGEFDYSQGAAVSLGLGSGGNGISPIWLSSFTAFLEAEAALALGITTAGTPRALLSSGMTQSINKVVGFPTAIGYSNSSIPANAFANTTQIGNYMNLVLSNYDAAATNDAKLDIIESEYYIALWGNGVEPYNNLRRTGKPGNVQIAVAVPAPGLFMRSFYYPSVFVNRNSNAPAQKTPGTAANKVFWDNNPDNFIK